MVIYFKYIERKRYIKKEKQTTNITQYLWGEDDGEQYLVHEEGEDDRW